MIVGVNLVVGAGFGLLLMRLRNRSLRLRLPSQKITVTKSTQISVVFMILLLSNCSSCKMLLTAWTHYDVDRKWDRSLFICFEAGGVELPEIRHVNVRLSQQALPDKLANAVTLRAHDLQCSDSSEDWFRNQWQINLANNSYPRDWWTFIGPSRNNRKVTHLWKNVLDILRKRSPSYCPYWHVVLVIPKRKRKS